MNTLTALTILAIAALLEAGGDALVRGGLHATSNGPKLGFLIGGAAVLFVYGVTVNTPSWDFGRLLGVYVALFFVAAQAINYFAFHIQPGVPILLGGTLIVSGGVLMTVWR